MAYETVQKAAPGRWNWWTSSRKLTGTSNRPVGKPAAGAGDRKAGDEKVKRPKTGQPHWYGDD